MFEKAKLLAFLIILLAICGCQKKTATIGILQIADHPSLNAVRTGFVDYLNKEGYEVGKNLIVDYQNADGKTIKASEIAKDFSSKKVDFILAISTESARAALNSQDSIPVIFAAATDPVSSGLLSKFDNSQRKITGVTDLVPVEAQFALFRSLIPAVKRIGIIYNPAESYADVQVKLMQKYAAETGILLLLKEVKSGTSAIHAAKDILGEVDIVYVPTDKTVTSKLDEINLWAQLAKKPVFAGEAGGVNKGSLAAIGVNYYKLGQQTGEMALKLLRKEKKVSQVDVEHSKNNDTYINIQTAKALDLVLPEHIRKQAKVMGN